MGCELQRPFCKKVQVVVEFKIEDGTGLCEDKRKDEATAGMAYICGVMKVYKYFLANL
jgi:hypothetical protein